jgi:hypothetical protein
LVKLHARHFHQNHFFLTPLSKRGHGHRRCAWKLLLPTLLLLLLTVVAVAAIVLIVVIF